MSDSTEKTQEHRGICGLINLGNTCYLNASIQILRSIPEWAAFCANDPDVENEAFKAYDADVAVLE